MLESGAALRPARLNVLAAFAAVYVIWGSTYLGIRFAIETLPPFLMAGARFLIAGTLLGGMMRLRGAPRPSLAQWGSASVIGGFMLLGGNGVVTWAEQRVPSGIAALMIATVPLWMVTLDWMQPGGMRPNGRVVAGVVLGFAGMVLLASPGELAGSKGVDPVGAGALVLAALLWSIGSLYSRRASLPGAPLQGIAMEMLAGGVLLTLTGMATGEWARIDLAAVSLRSVLALGYLTIFGSLVAFSAYVWLLKVTTPARAATYAYVNPVVAVFLGWALAGEPLAPRTFLAMAIIVAAVVITTIYREQPSQKAALAENEA